MIVLFDDIMSTRKEKTFVGHIRFVGDSGSNDHDNRFWAFSLLYMLLISRIGPQVNILSK